jgi:hypothetical protein
MYLVSINTLIVSSSFVYLTYHVLIFLIYTRNLIHAALKSTPDTPSPITTSVLKIGDIQAGEANAS